MKSLWKSKVASLILFAGVAMTAPTMAKEAPQLSDRTFRTVNKVQELIATEKYSAAKEKLASALESTSSKKYDRAVLLQQTGFLYSLQDNYVQAAKYFAEALQLDALPVPVAQQVRYSLAQLYLAEEKYTLSVKTMKEWFKVAETTKEKPQAHAYITLASAYVQLEDYKNAIPPTKKSHSRARASESWYLILVASHYELGQLKSVASVLKTLTSKYPQKKRYWMQLSGVYMELGQERNSLATLEMVYKMGKLEGEKEYLRFVNFLAYQGIPYKAAKTLEKEMAAGNIEKTKENYDRLASFWQQAKELDKSILAYKKSYNLAPSAKTQIQIARLMIQDKQYSEATRFVESAASSASKEQKAELEYIRGMAYFELKQPQKALQAMKGAAQSPKFRSTVSPWINFLESQG
ncbi:LOW QUALITY PROTEIN: TPR domain protein, putative component of TonB system [Vibrio sp. JCM 19053]|nr:LOW QUALITY PROTEIN: TPR domain protein, putative component of TonB system [Vibrio sp. JCM 19053]